MTIPKLNWFLLLIIVCAVAISAWLINSYLTYLTALYQNRIGQRRVEQVAELLKVEMEKNKTFDSEIFMELQKLGVLTDGRGVPIEIESLTEESFSLKYVPPVFRKNIFTRSADQSVVVKWKRGMSGIDVVSSIPFP